MDYKKRQEIIAGSPISFAYLKRFNIAAGVLHLIQGVLMLALGLLLTWSRDVYTFYLKIGGSPPHFTAIPNPQVLFTISNLGSDPGVFSSDFRDSAFRDCVSEKQELQ
jgi:hypothetical protein